MADPLPAVLICSSLPEKAPPAAYLTLYQCGRRPKRRAHHRPPAWSIEGYWWNNQMAAQITTRFLFWVSPRQLRGVSFDTNILMKAEASSPASIVNRSKQLAPQTLMACEAYPDIGTSPTDRIRATHALLRGDRDLESWPPLGLFHGYTRPSSYLPILI